MQEQLAWERQSGLKIELAFNKQRLAKVELIYLVLALSIEGGQETTL